MDNAFIQAFRPSSPKVCGLRLKPFCLGAILDLEALHNPVSAAWGEVERDISILDVYQAAKICAGKKGKLSLWDRFKAYSFANSDEHIKFAAYLAESFQAPEIWSEDGEGKDMGSPWLLSKAVYLQINTNFSHQEILSMPLAQVCWYCAAVSEQTSNVSIISEEEKKILDEVEQARKGANE